MLTIRSTYHRLCSALQIAGASLVLCACAPGLADAAHGSTLLIEGAGDGHGVGMSQEGALGYALHGLGYREILAHYYSGTEIGQAPTGTVVRVLIGRKVQRIPLETYVRGVISAEMPADWPLAALEAQAVASRTYALTDHAGGSKFDVYADTRSQVYRGAAAETPETNAAVAATAGQLVVYGGSPAITYFFASSGGMTENVENAFPGALPEPWLRAVPDPYDQGPTHRWELSLSFAAAAARLRGLVRGTFEGIEVLKRGISPRILSAYVLGSAGRTLLSGSELAARLGLYDTWAYFSVSNGRSITPEPDRSGWPASAQTNVSSPPASAGSSSSTLAGPEGGVKAPGGAPPSASGGAAAG